MRGTHDQPASVPEARQRGPFFHDRRIEPAIVQLGSRCDAGAHAVLAAVGERDQQRAHGAGIAVELEAIVDSPVPAPFAHADARGRAMRRGCLRPRLLNCFATRASKPMPAMLKNGRPAIMPASIVRVRPSRAMARAARGVARHAERAGEPVARAGTHECDRGVGVQQARARFVHRAVAAPDDDQLRTGGGARGREIARVAGALGHMDLRATPSPLDLAPHERDAARAGRRVRAGAGDRVDDRDDRHEALKASVRGTLL